MVISTINDGWCICWLAASTTLRWAFSLRFHLFVGWFFPLVCFVIIAVHSSKSKNYEKIWICTYMLSWVGACCLKLWFCCALVKFSINEIRLDFAATWLLELTMIILPWWSLAVYWLSCIKIWAWWSLLWKLPPIISDSLPTQLLTWLYASLLVWYNTEFPLTECSMFPCTLFMFVEPLVYEFDWVWLLL